MKTKIKNKISIAQKRRWKKRKRSLITRIILCWLFISMGLGVSTCAIAYRLKADYIINHTEFVEMTQCENGKFATDCSLIDTEWSGATASGSFISSQNDKGDNKNAPSVILNKTVEEQIRQIAKEENFKWEDYLVRLAYHESRFNPYATNLNKGHSLDAGVFQINQYYHPEVGLKCSLDVRCATLWTMKMIDAGKQHLWCADEKAKAGW